MSDISESVGEQVVEVSPNGIQRYDISPYSDRGNQCCLDIDEHKEGEWVKYDDHIRAMLNPLGAPLCQDMPSLYRMFQFLLDNIADLEESPDFAGFKLQRATNDEGELQFIRIIPCDKIGDVTVPRYADVENTLQLVKG